MTQDGPKMNTKIAPSSSRWPQDGPRWPQDGPRWSQDGPKMRRNCPKMAQDGPTLARALSVLFPRSFKSTGSSGCLQTPFKDTFQVFTSKKRPVPWATATNKNAPCQDSTPPLPPDPDNTKQISTRNAVAARMRGGDNELKTNARATDSGGIHVHPYIYMYIYIYI